MKNEFLIFGGGLVNKGAQAMTYITTYEIMQRFPDAHVTLFSTEDYNRTDIDKDSLSFSIRPFSAQTLFYHLGGFYRIASYLLRLKKHSLPDYELNDLLHSSKYMVNISGFALSSKWGFYNSLSYLLTIKLMKKYSIDVVLMPQSFGPLSFKGIKAKIFDWFAKKYLTYPKCIFAREKEGYDILVKSYGLDNVRLSPDLVLQNKKIDYSMVIKKIPADFLTVPDYSVAIIPNVRLLENTNVKLMDIYEKTISYLLKKDVPVTILYHSTEDRKLCVELKNRFTDNPNVLLVDKEMDCYEFQKLVKKFRYVIAARYHSIVHSYKAAIPCITLGWAIKYQELMKLFNQEEYSIDISSLKDECEIIELIGKMEQNLSNNKMLIINGLDEVQKNNCFSVLQERNTDE